MIHGQWNDKKVSLRSAEFEIKSGKYTQEHNPIISSLQKLEEGKYYKFIIDDDRRLSYIESSFSKREPHAYLAGYQPVRYAGIFFLDSDILHLANVSGGYSFSSLSTENALAIAKALADGNHFKLIANISTIYDLSPLFDPHNPFGIADGLNIFIKDGYAKRYFLPFPQ